MPTYENFYPGTQYSLESGYGNFVGYREPAENIGLTTDARMANVLKAASDNLSTGAKVIEIGGVSPEIFESIPEQVLEETKRLSKLTGVDLSVHAPVVEASGITKQGWSETERKAVERQVQMALERSHKLDKDGNIPVTFHSTAGIPGTEYEVEGGKEKEKMIIAINQETGQMIPLKEEVRHYPEVAGKKEIYAPQKMLEIVNETEWSDKLLRIQHYLKEADEIQSDFNQEKLKQLLFKKMQGQELSENEKQQFEYLNQKMRQAEGFRSHAYASLRSAFDEAYKYGKLDQEVKKQLDKAAEDYKRAHEEYVKSISSFSENPEAYIKAGEKRTKAMSELIDALSQVKETELYTPVEKFAVEKSAETFGRAAFNAYKKFGEKAPTLSIENPPAGMGLSRAEDIKNLVEKSREKFIEAAKEEGMSESQARKEAEKLIGATWDVGHINMLRKFGFGEKELIKETEKIAPFVKHVHLSDNFGFEHTELPMGMGNVPIKEIMKRLGKEGFKGKKIVEAISWWQHFSQQGKIPPFGPTLEAFGSPVYPGGPYWNQARGFIQGYSTGYGRFLPEQNFSIYGAGWSTLPTELGGQMPGGQSRLSGTPNQ